MQNISAPIAWIEIVNNSIYLTIFTTPWILKVFIAFCKINLSLRVIFLPSKIAINVVKDINPSPPISINSIITVWPNKFQWVPVSTVTSPVTHTAEVDVNTASIKLVYSPVDDEIGNDSNIPPMSIINRKPSERICIGFNLNPLLNLYCIYSPLLNEIYNTKIILYQIIIHYLNKSISIF